MSWLLALGVVGLALVALVAVFQRRLIYLPLTQNVASVREVLPGAREVRYETADGLSLAAWLVEPAVRARALVVVFNGNAGHREMRAPLAAALAARGLAVLLTDYRGFGGNPGSPTEKGLSLDARAAVDFVTLRLRYPLRRVVYFGESLGSGVAVALAVDRAPAALVLRSPFPSLAAVGRRHYPFLPVGSLLRDRFASIDLIGRVRSPVLVIAGDRDRIVPLDLSRRLFRAAAEPKRLVVVAGADHNDFALLAGEALVEETVTFVHRALVAQEEEK